MAEAGVITSIGTGVNDLVDYFSSKPHHMMKAPALIGKWGEFYRGEELGSSTFVKRAAKPARAYHIIEFVADVKNLFKAVIDLKNITRETSRGEIGYKIEEIFNQSCSVVEAYPRSYKAYAYFSCSDRKLPGGDKAKTAGDIAGFFAGMLIFKRSVMALWDLDKHCFKIQNKEVLTFNTRWDRGVRKASTRLAIGDNIYSISSVPGRTTQKITQIFWAAFGACFAIAEALAVAKKFEVINKDNVPKVVSLVISTCSTFSFLAASYQSS